MYNIFVGILHAVGDSKHPLYYLMISTGVNVVLDLVLVAGLGFGVGAAAIATTISQGISALLCCIRLIRVKEPYRLRLKKIRFHWESLKSIIRFGLPSGVQNSVIAMANLVVQSNINSFGKAAMAGCAAHAKIEGFAFLPITCFSMALSTFVGQNLGAKKHDRVRKGVLFGILCSVIACQPYRRGKKRKEKHADHDIRGYHPFHSRGKLERLLGIHLLHQPVDQDDDYKGQPANSVEYPVQRRQLEHCFDNNSQNAENSRKLEYPLQV
jgi:O-antigen/teichoic acid export membrane protein